MKKSTFVSFSSMIQQSAQSKQEPPSPREPEIDYEALYLESKQENERLVAQASELQQNYEQEKISWSKEKEELKDVLNETSKE